ncbi:hypothetical protein C8Q74DRAFT_1195685 [Fomes fomentarius]|nr:hypothetical protein C8Q74DRAFT_1195685 [Fomes fomentarius]
MAQATKPPSDSSPTNTGSTASIIRDSEIWFDDGNIIVIAQQTAFRFHRGVLSRHSVVFRELFGIPYSSTSEPGIPDSMEGCPAVHVTDTSCDFRRLLCAIYDGMSYMHPDKPVQFSVLASLARLAHKYQLDFILEESIRRLKTIYTSKFEIWDKHQGISHGGIELKPCDALEAFNLFRRVDQPEMLPTAFYACCRLKTSQILHGTERSDGTLEILEPGDLERCLDSRIALQIHGAQAAVLSYDVHTDQGCSKPPLCGTTLRNQRRAFPSSTPEILGTHPLTQFLAYRAEQFGHMQLLCPACVKMLRQNDLERRLSVWRDLPRIFGLDVLGWADH